MLEKQERPLPVGWEEQRRSLRLELADRGGTRRSASGDELAAANLPPSRAVAMEVWVPTEHLAPRDNPLKTRWPNGVQEGTGICWPRAGASGLGLVYIEVAHG